MKGLWEASRKVVWVSHLVRSPLIAVGLLGFFVVQVAAGWLGFSFWRCPLKTFAGVECPGCGLTTGTRLFLKGDFGNGVAANVLVPFVVGGAVVLAVSLAVPRRLRGVVADWVEDWERKWRLGFWLILVFVGQVGWWAVGWA
ncbi:MAG: DUF2752 domain-containing protein [Verrucomicrobiota bacterium]